MPRMIRFNLAATAFLSLALVACAGGGASPDGASVPAASIAGASATPTGEESAAPTGEESAAPIGSAAGSAAAGTIEVTLQEWAVLPAIDSAPAGDVTFVVTNEGPADVHELVVIRTDLDPGELPTDETGTVDETAEGIEVVDEIEDIPVGETQELTVTLDPGSYALICNIYSEEEGEAHYQMGMYTGFTAE